MPEASPCAGRERGQPGAARPSGCRPGGGRPARGRARSSVLPAASREPTAPEVRGLASQARARSAHRSAAGLRGPRVVRVGGQPALRQVARRADREQPGGRGQLDHEGGGRARRRAAARATRPEVADRRARRCAAPPDGCRAPVVQQQLDPAYGVERGARPPPGPACAGSWVVVTSSGGTSTGPSPGSGTRPSSSATTVSARSPAADSQTSAWSSSRATASAAQPGVAVDQSLDLGARGLARGDQGM